MSDVNVTFEPEKVSVEALAHLGEGHIAYVKQVRSEDVPGLFPQAPKIAPGLKLFALHAAGRLQQRRRDEGNDEECGQAHGGQRQRSQQGVDHRKSPVE